MSHWSKQKITRRRPLWFALLAIFVSAPLIGGADEGNWTLGTKSFSTTAHVAAPLRISSVGTASLHSFAFVGKVGGVNFETVATFDPDPSGLPFDLRYDGEAPDGQRLVLAVGDRSYRPKLPDWQLVPIARFAHSEFTAAVSLFGEGPDENYYYIQYHDAFQDSLLGMRLLQADILLMDVVEHALMPRLDGQLVLGALETEPSPQEQIQAAVLVDAILEQGEFTSWVLTDTQNPPSFKLGEELTITGDAYFHFWRRDESGDAMFEARVAAWEADVKRFNQAIEQHDALVDEYNTGVKRQDVVTTARLEPTLNELGRTIEALKPRLEATQAELERWEPGVLEVPALTPALKERPDLLQKLNPAVYDSVQRTYRFAALFRYAKRRDPAGWERFVQRLEEVTLTPRVRTPTRLPRSVAGDPEPATR